MEHHRKSEYIKLFARKHKTSFDKFADPECEVIRFANGRYFDINEIAFDIDHNVPVGVASIFNDYGANGNSNKTYQEWYEKRSNEFSKEVHHYQ